MKEKVKVGNVLTDEIMSAIGNEDITDSQVGQLMRGILFRGRFAVAPDALVKVLMESYYKDYVKLTISCAEGKLKELERLNKFYSKSGREVPSWFPAYYAANVAKLKNDILTLGNIIGMPNNVSANVSGDGTNISVTLAEHKDNVTQTFAIDNNTNTKANTKTKSKTNIESIPPISPKGEDGEISSASPQPRSALDDPMTALGLAKAGAAAEDSGEAAKEAREIADEITRTYRYHVNEKKLLKCLLSVLKKNSAAEIRDGYRAWLETWQGDDFQWAPQRITDWLYDGRYLDAPRRGNNRRAEAATQFGGSDLA